MYYLSHKCTYCIFCYLVSLPLLVTWCRHPLLYSQDGVLRFASTRVCPHVHLQTAMSYSCKGGLSVHVDPELVSLRFMILAIFSSIFTRSFAFVLGLMPRFTPKCIHVSNTDPTSFLSSVTGRSRGVYPAYNGFNRWTFRLLEAVPNMKLSCGSRQFSPPDVLVDVLFIIFPLMPHKAAMCLPWSASEVVH